MYKHYLLHLSVLAVVSALSPFTSIAQTTPIGLISTQSFKTFTGKRDVSRTKPLVNRSSLLKADPLKRAPQPGEDGTYNVPYLETFDTYDDFNTYTVIDANEDNSTWDFNESEQEAQYTYNSTYQADDWLISPGINLKGGKTYNVAFKAGSTSSYYSERLEAKWGSGSSIDELTEELLPKTDIASDNMLVFEKEITPAEDGVYYFGFHAISDADMYALSLDSFSISLPPDAGSPDTVTNLKAVGDPNGELKVTLSFNAPTTAINGSELDAIDSIKILKNNNEIASIKPVTPGSEYSYIDNEANAGINYYSVVATNGNGDGRTAKVSAVAGPDIPTAPQVTATDNLTSVKFTWPDVKGQNGGPIVPADVSYEIFNTDDGYVEDPIETVKGVNEYNLDYNTQEGNQEIKQWAFMAQNGAGESDYSMAGLVVGAPYTLPYANSFKGGSSGGQFFGLAVDDLENTTWELNTDNTADNDGGAVEFTNSTSDGEQMVSGPGSSIFFTGKINLNGAASPKLIFSYNGTTSIDAHLNVEIRHQDGTVVSIWSKNFTDGDGTWSKEIVSLPASITNEPYVFIQFHGTADSSNPSRILIDDIHVADLKQNDASLSLKASPSINKGQTADLTATISNLGIDDLSNLELKVSVNDILVADTTIDATLAVFDSINVPISYKTSSVSEANTLNVKAEVINSGDIDESNNTATATIDLAQADLKKPENLEATTDGQLTWTAPEQNTTDVNEGFESYTPWALDEAGDWTFVNADGAGFGMFNDSYDYAPNTGYEAAYEIWRPDGAFEEQDDRIEPHSGEQCLASVYKVSNDQSGFSNTDDWAISPELPGIEQTVTFWAKDIVDGYDYGDNYGTETFQFLTSSTDSKPSSFTQLGDDYVLDKPQWQEFSIDIPAGTRYFAVRRITSGDMAYVLFLDDFTFQAGKQAASYNIYVDGNFVGNTTDTSYDARSDGKSHKYSVTAVYSDGSESEPVSVDIIVNGVESVHSADGQKIYNVYTIGGGQVMKGSSNLRSLHPGVYIINGKKVLVK